MPKVSVVIPAYNSLKYLPATMESVLRQTFNDFEVILVNDGSSDNTENWVSQIADPRVKLITQENQGLSGARNTGIAHASGKYIAFLDADDLWEPTKLEKQVLCLEENSEIGLVYTWVALIDENGNSTGRVFKNYAENDVWHQIIEHNIVESGSVAMVRRQCFETCGVFDRNLRSFVEDWDMWLRIASRYPFKVLKEPLVYYRQHSTSASRNWEAMEQSFRIVIEKAFASAPPKLHYLKGRSYGCAHLCLAWKPLQSRNKDYKKAMDFQRQALEYCPQLGFSKENIRLSLAIAAFEWFGSDGYSRVLKLLYGLRRRIQRFAR
ncbi:MAG: glycosyltransferase family A protein [Nostoc sp. CmiVER01]|uniref:glycosyltransferase family 2 protein n=1 Tax=Nostoc sp. CmiVER01 TaxID=3075384 RepID=UPI002AD59745|nr:glycosyltransferase family A protein [Nostoc sp. CmiVER01]MDZ8121406.1 glycosyltransferase family A protein [Nostoc sp. CmiVER01]